MRISSTQFFQTGLNSINTQQADLLHLYQKIGSGQRMVTPADDPLAASQAINLSQSQSLNNRFAANREAAMRSLGTTENALDTTTNVMQSIKTRLVEAANGTLSDTDRATLSSVLKDSRDALLGLANTTDGNGQYLFSGSRGNAPAYVEVNGNVVYQGDKVQRKVQVDQTRQLPGTDVGSDIFGRAAPGTSLYLTRAGDANTGTGTVGAPAITDPRGVNVGKTFTIEFTAADKYTVKTLDALGNDTFVDANGAPSATAVEFDYTAGETTQLTLPGGVQVKVGGQPAVGDTFVAEPANTAEFVASATTGGAGVTVGSARVTDYAQVNDNYGYRLTFTSDSAYNLEIYDVSAPGTALETSSGTFVPGEENTIDLPYGMQVKLTGTPANGDVFNVEPAEPTSRTDLNIFETLDAIILELEKPTNNNPEQAARLANTMATAMQRVDVVYNNVLTVRSSVGARMNEIDSLNANGEQRSLGYSKELSRLEDLDYYEAITQMQLRTTAMEAASQAFRKIQSLGLFNMGR